MAVLPQWVVARVIVLGALALAHLVVTHTRPAAAGVALRVHQGLLGWDAGWYEAIARRGYAPYGHQALRFFPLVPLATRALAVLPGVSDGTALLIIANASALVATALLFVLVRRELGDEATARRAAWLFCLVPPAFTLVMGYAEATLLVFTVGCFLAVRRPGHVPGRQGEAGAFGAPAWCWAALAGFGAGLTRPLGVLVALGVGFEAVRWWRVGRSADRVASVVATVAPLAGMAVFLGWARAVYGDFFLPLRVQTQSGHHGGITDPIHTLIVDARGVLHHHYGTALHVPWVLVVAALLVVCWFRLPASYSLFATAVVLVAATGTNLDSFERYAMSAFPLVVVGATLTAGRTVERTVFTLAAAGLAGYALLAFLNLSVP